MDELEHFRKQYISQLCSDSLFFKSEFYLSIVELELLFYSVMTLYIEHIYLITYNNKKKHKYKKSMKKLQEQIINLNKMISVFSKSLRVFRKKLQKNKIPDTITYDYSKQFILPELYQNNLKHIYNAKYFDKFRNTEFKTLKYDMTKQKDVQYYYFNEALLSIEMLYIYKNYIVELNKIPDVNIKVHPSFHHYVHLIIEQIYFLYCGMNGIFELHNGNNIYDVPDFDLSSLYDFKFLTLIYVFTIKQNMINELLKKYLNFIDVNYPKEIIIARNKYKIKIDMAK
jgi:hypothetical protein